MRAPVPVPAQAQPLPRGSMARAGRGAGAGSPGAGHAGSGALRGWVPGTSGCHRSMRGGPGGVLTPGSLSLWSRSLLCRSGSPTWASRRPAPDSSHGAGPAGPGRGLVCRDAGAPGRHRLREGCVRRADTDNTAGAPPPPALKGAAPAPGGAWCARRSSAGGGRED